MKWLITQAIQAVPKAYIAFAGIHYLQRMCSWYGCALLRYIVVALAIKFLYNTCALLPGQDHDEH